MMIATEIQIVQMESVCLLLLQIKAAVVSKLDLALKDNIATQQTDVLLFSHLELLVLN